MNDPVVVVTGGGRGIGRAVCRRFAREGSQVVAASRTQADLEETCRLIVSDGGHCHVVPADIREPDEVHSLIGSTASRLGRVDVLVNCAGVAPLEKIEALEPDVFEAVLSVNVRAVYHACRAVWSIMREQGGGVIVNFSSMSSVDPFPGFAAYGAAKAWVNTWTKALAEEGRDAGIRVFAVAPGAVETGMLRDAFPDFPSDQTIQPEDVADVVFRLAQPDCRYVAGQTVFVKR
jgi:3-oxoacyl-[acyl-carrier protein] reductase